VEDYNHTINWIEDNEWIKFRIEEEVRTQCRNGFGLRHKEGIYSQFYHQTKMKVTV